jgi:hypothetical protein
MIQLPSYHISTDKYITCVQHLDANQLQSIGLKNVSLLQSSHPNCASGYLIISILAIWTSHLRFFPLCSYVSCNDLYQFTVLRRKLFVRHTIQAAHMYSVIPGANGQWFTSNCILAIFFFELASCGILLSCYVSCDDIYVIFIFVRQKIFV